MAKSYLWCFLHSKEVRRKNAGKTRKCDNLGPSLSTPSCVVAPILPFEGKP